MIGINYMLITISFLFFLQAEFSTAVEEYQQKALEVHNAHRAKHGSPLLKLNDTLNEMSVICAKYYIDKNDADHSCKNNSGHGENLYSSWGEKLELNNSIYHAEGASNVWYNEIERFDWENPIANLYLKFLGVGHLTQLLWKSTKELGIGYSEGKNQDGNVVVVVATYSPAGNYGPEAKENVPPLKDTSPNVGPQWLALACGLFVMMLI